MATEFKVPRLSERMSVETRFEIPANAPASGSNVFNLMKDDLSNIMIHMRVDRDRLVLNSCSNGTWGSEFIINSQGIGTPGNLVTLRAEVRSDHFYVTVNGSDHYEFKYRLPYTDINKGFVGSGIKFYTIFL